MPRPKILFICTVNVSRSRTAETLFVGSSNYEAKSAGIKYHEDGKQLVTQKLIDWADMLILMDEVNDRHYTYVRTNFNIVGKEVFILRIPNIYQPGDSKLIDLLKLRLAEFGIRAQ